MNKEEILNKLKFFVTDMGVSKSQLERDLGYLRNGLSAILSGKKELPDKWVNRFSDRLGLPPYTVKNDVLYKWTINGFVETGATVEPSYKEGGLYRFKNQKFVEQQPNISDKSFVEVKLDTSDLKSFGKDGHYRNASLIIPNTPESYDGKKYENRLEDSDKWTKMPSAEEAFDNSAIEAQIKAIEAEKLPEHRNSVVGKKSWNLEQKKRIQELKNQLK